jgi:hypothetical protein
LTLKLFIAAAYALMVRTYAGIPGQNLLDAIESTDNTFGIEQPEEVKEENVEARNEASLKQLEKMMRGVR